MCFFFWLCDHRDCARRNAASHKKGKCCGLLETKVPVVLSHVRQTCCDANINNRFEVPNAQRLMQFVPNDTSAPNDLSNLGGWRSKKKSRERMLGEAAHLENAVGLESVHGDPGELTCGRGLAPPRPARRAGPERTIRRRPCVERQWGVETLGDVDVAQDCPSNGEVVQEWGSVSCVRRNLGCAVAF